MNKTSKLILKILAGLVAIPIFFIASLVFVIGPVDTSKENSIEVKGEIMEIFEGPSYDIVFMLADRSTTYYINRGIERGLTIQQLEDQLLGEQVNLWYAKSWPMEEGLITLLALHGDVLFSEW